MRSHPLTIRGAFGATVFAVVAFSPAFAGPIGTGFTSGDIRAAGFPTPLRQNNFAPVNLKGGSGGGSTGGGFDGVADRALAVGSANATIQIIDGVGTASVLIDGTAWHNNFDGFTASWTQVPIVLEVTKGVEYEITNNSGTWSSPQWWLTEPVTFEPITGAIIPSGPLNGVLQAGSYRISFGVAAGRMDSFEAQQSVFQWYWQFGANRMYDTEMHWSLKLTHKDTYAMLSPRPGTTYYVQGQSFTPGTLAAFADPTSPKASPEYLALTDFRIDFASVPQAIPDKLYIYTSPPTAAEAASGTGSLATGTHAGDGLYLFNKVPLDFRTKYFAVLPQPRLIHDGPGDVYTGGVDLFLRTDMNPARVAEGYGNFDIGFTASFEYVGGCPADINLDGLVDDSDFQEFVVGYEALMCNGPGMPANCPANLNTDVTVDDTDFGIFVVAYNELLCP